MKVLLIGSADIRGNTIGGQYEKTKQVFNFLNKEKEVTVEFYNMFEVGRTIRFLIGVIKRYFANDCIIVITSLRGTKAITKLLLCLQLIKKKSAVYLIVGNQQAYLKSLSSRTTKAMKKVYFEIERMQDELRGKFNVGFFPNCKDIQPKMINYREGRPLRICYYSEISYRKGFDRIIRALDTINSDFVKYHMDVYGFLPKEDNSMRKLLDGRSFVDWKGTIKREQSQDTLSRYCFMVFPSRHMEGVPGAIVDAYEAGLPVVCSNTGYLSDVVINDQTGYLFDTDEQLVSILINIYNNINLIDQLKMRVIEEAYKYDIKKHIKELHNDLIEISCKVVE